MNNTWTLTVTCTRPPNRARDNFHTQPDKLATWVTEWFGPTAELTLTARTVRFRVSGTGEVGDLGFWHRKLAHLLHTMMLGTRKCGTDERDGQYQLPRPIHTEVREREPNHG